jgi:hypothetical protein
LLGWQSEDDTVRFVGYQALQTGNLGLAFKKGADNAALACDFMLEKPTSNPPWQMYFAGATRGA